MGPGGLAGDLQLDLEDARGVKGTDPTSLQTEHRMQCPARPWVHLGQRWHQTYLKPQVEKAGLWDQGTSGHTVGLRVRTGSGRDQMVRDPRPVLTNLIGHLPKGSWRLYVTQCGPLRTVGDSRGHPGSSAQPSPTPADGVINRATWLLLTNQA